MDDAGGDPFSIRYGGAVGSRARLVANRVARRIRAALSAGRAVVAGLDSLRCPDALANPQFCLYSESQLPGDHRPATHPFPR